MRIERISENQFTIFLTFEDLVERGFTKDDLWHDASNLESLFRDMMYEASFELGFELEGMLFIQVHLMQAQGMHIIVTQNYDENEDEDYVEMQVTLDESDELIFSFDDFENIIQVSSYLNALSITGGQVYLLNEHYYLILEDQDFDEHERANIIAILSEFAKPSIVTSHRLFEYGKRIFEKDAVKEILKYFFDQK